MLITNLNRQLDIKLEELKRQNKVLQMEKDAKYLEVEDFRRRLHLSKRENQRLTKLCGQEVVEEGSPPNDD